MSKKDKQWVWLAINRDTREVIGVHSGGRSREGAQALWESIPDFYGQNARFCTDFWETYQGVFPADHHQAVGKETRKTNHIERFNCTLRQSVSRWVRKTRSFSKKLEHHRGAIGYFIHHCHANIRN